jgi:hypothetical protein
MRASRSAVAVVLLAAACTDVQLRLVGPSYPARPTGCAVDVRGGETTLPDGAFVDIASGTVSCLGGRDRCVEEIRKQACAIGADVVYAFSESSGGGFTNVEARYAARKHPAADAVSGGR